MTARATAADRGGQRPTVHGRRGGIARGIPATRVAKWSVPRALTRRATCLPGVGPGRLILVALTLTACTDSTDPNFDPTEITVHVSGSGNGSGHVVGPPVTGVNCAIDRSSALGSCRETFVDAGGGGTFVLDALPDSISTFVQWGGDCLGGNCTLSFPQGKDTTFTVIARFVLHPPTVTIVEPANGESFTVNDVIRFRGTGTDAAGRAFLNVFDWRSSGDGILCSTSAQNPDCSAFSRTLSQGAHTITVVVADDGGTPGSASVDIMVGPPANRTPVVEIITPSSGASFPSDQPVRLAGSATDEEDGQLPDSVRLWSSSRDGALGAGGNLDVMLSAGNHIIRLSATDSQGAIGTDSVDISVFMPAAGPGTISGRVTGNGLAVGGASLTLSGTTSASTVSDGSGNYTFANLAPGTYTVSVSVALNINFPSPAQTVTLAAGEHMIVNFAGTY